MSSPAGSSSIGLAPQLLAVRTPSQPLRPSPCPSCRLLVQPLLNLLPQLLIRLQLLSGERGAGEGVCLAGEQVALDGRAVDGHPRIRKHHRVLQQQERNTPRQLKIAIGDTL